MKNNRRTSKTQNTRKWLVEYIDRLWTDIVTTQWWVFRLTVPTIPLKYIIEAIHQAEHTWTEDGWFFRKNNSSLSVQGYRPQFNCQNNWQEWMKTAALWWELYKEENKLTFLCHSYSGKTETPNQIRCFRNSSAMILIFKIQQRKNLKIYLKLQILCTVSID